MICRICSTKNEVCFTSKIINKYVIDYSHCTKCDFVQTEDPYWLDEAYSMPINSSDTGYMKRNLIYSQQLTVLLFLLFGRKGKFLDYAGGYGVFVRIMRDIGFNFEWADKYTKNLFADGFNWDYKSEKDAITLFEVFEHFVNPAEEIKNLLKQSNTIIFSTQLRPEPIPKPTSWNYYGLHHGQHLSFYSLKTFKFIANQFDLNYYNIGSLHILTNKKVSKFKIFLTKISSFGIYLIIKSTLKSKTQTDYVNAVSKQNERNKQN